MSISSISGLSPLLPALQPQAAVAAKPVVQAAPPTLATDSDGDNDGSAPINIKPPVDITA